MRSWAATGELLQRLFATLAAANSAIQGVEVETKRVRAKNGRIVEWTYLSTGERWAITVGIAFGLVFAVFMMFSK